MHVMTKFFELEMTLIFILDKLKKNSEKFFKEREE